MHIYNCRSIIIISFWIQLISLTSCAQNRETVLNKLNTEISGLDLSNNVIFNNAQFKAAKVIALGESTHGTAEFNKIRSAIIKTLILNHELKILAFEADLASSLILNDYLTGDSKDSLINYFYKSGFYGVYQTQEIYDLLNWIKEYNQTKDKDNKILVLGFDMQNPYSITQRILSDFTDLIKLDKDVYDKLVAYNERSSQSLKNRKVEIFDKALLEKLKMLSTANSNKPFYFRINKYLDLLSQCNQLQEESKFYEKAYDIYRSRRDKFMADNVLWLMRTYAKGGKMAIWSHNGHIAHAKLDNTYRMGYHLKTELGNNYYAVAQLFDEGSVRIYDFVKARKYTAFEYPSSTKQNSAEYIFKMCKLPVFYLDVNHLMKDSIMSSYFFRNDMMRVIGATYQPNPNKDYFHNAINSFDSCIFFRKANAASSIQIRK